jgi:hypothetical protein
MKWQDIVNVEVPRAVFVVVVAAVFVGVALLATGCHAPPVRAASVTGFEFELGAPACHEVPGSAGNLEKSVEKIETQSEPLSNAHLQYGAAGPYIMRAGTPRRYCATCHVSADPALTLKHARYASDAGACSSLLRAEQDRVP